MKFRQASAAEIASRDAGGLRGFVKATYDELVSCFGQPEIEVSDQSKVACEWKLLFGNDTAATIYSYQEMGMEKASIPQGYCRWHVGGASNRAVELVAGSLETSKFACLDDVSSPQPEPGTDDIPF